MLDDITLTSTVAKIASERAKGYPFGSVVSDLREIAGYTDADIDALTDSDLREIAEAVELASAQ